MAVVPMRKPDTLTMPNSLVETRRLHKRYQPRPRTRRRGKHPHITRARMDVMQEEVVDNTFIVPRDIAHCCRSKVLTSFMREAVQRPEEDMQTSSAHASIQPVAKNNAVDGKEAKEGSVTTKLNPVRPFIAALHPPYSRLILHLGSVDATTGAFRTDLSPRFATQLLRHVQKFPGWREHSRRGLNRYDYFLDNGVVLKTLFQPQQPHISTRASITVPHCRVVIPVHNMEPWAPSHLAWEELHECQCDLYMKRTLRYNRVRLNRCFVFVHNAWVYKITESWEGKTCEEAQRAMLVTQGHTQVSLELRVSRHEERENPRYLVASGLLRAHDLMTHCFETLQVPRFEPPQAMEHSW